MAKSKPGMAPAATRAWADLLTQRPTVPEQAAWMLRANLEG